MVSSTFLVVVGLIAGLVAPAVAPLVHIPIHVIVVMTPFLPRFPFTLPPELVGSVITVPIPIHAASPVLGPEMAVPILLIHVPPGIALGNASTVLIATVVVGPLSLTARHIPVPIPVPLTIAIPIPTFIPIPIPAALAIAAMPPVPLPLVPFCICQQIAIMLVLDLPLDQQQDQVHIRGAF
ncbi:hypothetical protein BCR44DRAFT_36898, partial [Catenaria anguillulae PL171]